MDKNEKWLDWAVELQALAQAGLRYTRDPYDEERFQRIREIAAEMIEYKSEIPLEKVKDVFCSEGGYQTPKIDTRAAIFDDGKILLVQENDGKWSLPGGWCDVNISPAENAVKEVREEAGLEAAVNFVIAVQDKDKHNLPIRAQKICKIFFMCSALGGHFRENSETIASGYFSLDSLPELSEEKSNREQIEMCFHANAAQQWTTRFD